tara:strand:+ start:139 stop:660 length:522 start_codon:yes stop_codon:yes gene_type:complete
MATTSILEVEQNIFPTTTLFTYIATTSTLLEVPVTTITTTTSTVETLTDEIIDSVVVEAGDSLSKIAKEYGTTAEVLADINGICNTNTIYVGQVILLTNEEKTSDTAAIEETSLVVVVESGDSLSKIAKQHGMEVDEIMALNNISDPNLLFVGDKLTITGKPPVETDEVSEAC